MFKGKLLTFTVILPIKLTFQFEIYIQGIILLKLNYITIS